MATNSLKPLPLRGGAISLSLESGLSQWLALEQKAQEVMLHNIQAFTSRGLSFPPLPLRTLLPFKQAQARLLEDGTPRGERKKGPAVSATSHSLDEWVRPSKTRRSQLNHCQMQRWVRLGRPAKANPNTGPQNHEFLQPLHSERPITQQ